MFPERLPCHPHRRGSMGRRWAKYGISIVVGTFVASCGSDAAPRGNQQKSRQPTLKFKGHQRLQNDLSRGLELPANELCLELGLYSCTEEVHRLALGGTDPYKSARHTPIPRVTLSAPMAAERIATAACASRVDRDLETPQDAVLFKDVPKTGAVAEDSLAESVTRLYKAALQRLPTAREREGLAELYRIAVAESDRPVRDWAVSACAMVFTSTEQLFY